MKNKKYFVWFFGNVVEVYASGLESAAILATAKRIESGLRTQITMIEEEQDDGTSEYVFGTGFVTLKEST